MHATQPSPTAHAPGTPVEVLAAFARLGLTSFGGPVAHLGYFRTEFVARRAWLDERAYAELVALCQFLPGPASSQVGFAIGLMRAGPLGGLAAWTGFTLPSAALLALFAGVAGRVAGPLGQAALHGLKLVAVAIVAQAVWGMARALCPDRTRATIGAGAAMLAACLPGAGAQLAAIGLGAAAGLVLCRSVPHPGPDALPASPVPRRAALLCLAAFAVLLGLLPLLGATSPLFAFIDAFYRSGALVFGGGHVVLPLLHDAVVAPGWVNEAQFLAGYGAAQAVPGPLFTFAAYLGAIAAGPAGAVVALIAIFAPGLLLVAGALPFWRRLHAMPGALGIVAGANAAVVGVLAAALHDPVWTGSVITGADFALAVAGFVLLTVWRAPPLLVVALTVLGAIMSGVPFFGANVT